MTDPLADKARAAWAELVKKVGPCDPNDWAWCDRHRSKFLGAHCGVWDAMDTMSDTLSMLLLERQP